MNQKQEAMSYRVLIHLEPQSRDEKWKCKECASITYQYLRSANPFNQTQELIWCPTCFSVSSLVRACDESGCTKEVCCYIQTKKGYRMTCSEHMSFTINALE
jgi:hypothetical protein